MNRCNIFKSSHTPNTPQRVILWDLMACCWHYWKSHKNPVEFRKNDNCNEENARKNAATWLGYWLGRWWWWEGGGLVIWGGGPKMVHRFETVQESWIYFYQQNTYLCQFLICFCLCFGWTNQASYSSKEHYTTATEEDYTNLERTTTDHCNEENAHKEHNDAGERQQNSEMTPR